MTPSSIHCELCDDTGWRTVADGSSKTSRVTRCDCHVSERSTRLLSQARIPRRYEHCEISNFSTEFQVEQNSLAEARFKAGKFAEEYPLEQSGLLFTGPVGVGKTHLAVGVLKALMLEKGIPCLFYDYRELLKEIQNSYNSTVKTTELEVLRPVFEVEVLLLDELGATKPTEWVWDTVSLILNTRYNDKRTTLVTTNFPDGPPAGARMENEPVDRWQTKKAAREETLGDRIGERMWSRLHEMCRKVEMNGNDFRQRVKSVNFPS